MILKGKRIGVAFTGSFCTYEKAFRELENLVRTGAEVQTVFSQAAASIDSRFGSPRDFLARARQITGRKPILTIEDAEPIGPGQLFDILTVLPCTGNTLAKLANGITDTSVTMAAKAHMRNGRPVIIALSTNDGLSGSAENIAKLLNRKGVYFVPFRQDDPAKKPRSLQADFSLLDETVQAALRGWQIQPILK